MTLLTELYLQIQKAGVSQEKGEDEQEDDPSVWASQTTVSNDFQLMSSLQVIQLPPTVQWHAC